MKYVLTLFLAITLFSCSKDDNASKCEFIGKWCIESFFEPGECFPGSNIEFRSNGEVIITGSSLKWKSSDCETIEIFDNATGTKGGEYEVHSVSNDEMILDIGAGPTTYIRAN